MHKTGSPIGRNISLIILQCNLSVWAVDESLVTKVACPDCSRSIAMHELETKTVAQRNDFQTNYRCPFCRSDINNVGDLL